METVSVLIPCYNGEKVIDRSIESVYSQEYEGGIELIVVDDGSTDKSKEKIMAWIPTFESKGYVLKYIFQNNLGLGGAINTGLKHVTGKYLSLLDADDCFLDGSIKKRTDFLQIHPDYTGVFSNGWYDKHGERNLLVLDGHQKEYINLFDGLIGGNAVNWAGAYMVRTDILFSFYPTRSIYPSRFGQNMQILLPVAYKNKFGFIDEPLMVYFLQDSSHSKAATEEEQRKKDDANFYGYLDIYMKMLDLIVNDKKEYDYYLNIIKSWQYRHELEKATLQKDKRQMKYFFNMYKSTGLMTLNDKISYYAVMNPIKMVLLKIYRRIKMMFTKVKGA